MPADQGATLQAPRRARQAAIGRTGKRGSARRLFNINDPAGDRGQRDLAAPAANDTANRRQSAPRQAPHGLHYRRGSQAIAAGVGFAQVQAGLALDNVP